MRIVFADPHEPSRLAFRLLIEKEPEFELIGEAEDAQGLLELLKNHPIDLALIDWMLPGMPLEEVIKALHSCQPRPVVLVMGSKPDYAGMLLKAGADAFITKGDQAGWLIEALNKYAKSPTKKNKER